MALVMLPCDLPWWDSVKKHLNKIAATKNTLQLIEGMQKIYDLCNISLDPDEDTNESDVFIGLLNFLDNELTSEERCNFFNKTLQSIVSSALSLKNLKPVDGLHFSLQQQSDCTELQYSFVSSLIANAFFSTFPKRTAKSHPTLQNFNFSHFFKHLDQAVQKTKLKSIFYYFDWLQNGDNSIGSVRISRQVMTSREWLTIEDWLECSLPLCHLQIKHEGKLERTETDSLQVCFASTKLGGAVLTDGNSQECINFVTVPELLTILLHVEALEDNEVLTIEQVRHLTNVKEPKKRPQLEIIEKSHLKTICCIDADDFKKLPLGQFEEDNILRELNKCLLGFQQKQFDLEANFKPNCQTQTNQHRLRRLSPIGESIGSQSDSFGLPVITQQSCSTIGSKSPPYCENNNQLRVQSDCNRNAETLLNNRRGRFIVLGSSGECLPVSRKPLQTMKSVYSSCDSSEEEFHSARTSLDDGSEDENYHKRYSIDLETAERRLSFAQRLKDALNREESNASSSSHSGYAVGISVTGSNVADCDFRVRRGGSTGFALHEDSLDEAFLADSLRQERAWIDKFRHRQTVGALSRKESNKSSEYSFSTEYSSELEEVYEQFSRWLQHPILEAERGAKRELEGRDLAVVQFAGSLLKRTLSESFAGVQVPLTENCEENECQSRRNKYVLNAKSLSLELARHKHKLAAQLLSQIMQKPTTGLKAVSTGNWGCGTSKCGDLQLKAIIQWLAASVAGVPTLKYHTCGNQHLTKLDTVCRILVDRKWCVKDLAQATLRYSNQVLHGREVGCTLFEELIGFERNVS